MKFYFKKYRKIIIVIFLIIVAIFFLFGSPKGWSRAEKYLDQFEVIEKQKLKKIRDSISDSENYHKLYVDSVGDVKIIEIPNQNNQIKRLIYENFKLKQELDSIRYAQYSKRKLDSFADSAKYQ